ncbi:MAG: hypothetical protein AAF483_22865 [Planctomycetota bacterium]
MKSRQDATEIEMPSVLGTFNWVGPRDSHPFASDEDDWQVQKTMPVAEEIHRAFTKSGRDLTLGPFVGHLDWYFVSKFAGWRFTVSIEWTSHPKFDNHFILSADFHYTAMRRTLRPFAFRRNIRKLGDRLEAVLRCVDNVEDVSFWHPVIV